MAKKKQPRKGEPLVEVPVIDTIKATITELGINLDDDWAHTRIYPEENASGQTMHGIITAPVWLFGLRRTMSYVFKWTIGVPTQLAEHRIDLYGRRLPAPPVKQSPYWVMPLGHLRPFILEAWRRDVSRTDNPFIAQIDWRPSWDKERASIRGGEDDRGASSDAAYDQMRTVQRAMLGMNVVEIRSGRHRIEDSEPEKLALARSYIERKAKEPNLSYREGAVWLKMADYEKCEGDSVLEAKEEKAAGERLRGYVQRVREIESKR